MATVRHRLATFRSMPSPRQILPPACARRCSPPNPHAGWNAGSITINGATYCDEDGFPTGSETTVEISLTCSEEPYATECANDYSSEGIWAPDWSDYYTGEARSARGAAH